jgi:hypothetical protein
MLLAADDEALDLALDDGTEQRIPYAEVAQARTVFEWGTKKAAKR